MGDLPGAPVGPGSRKGGVVSDLLAALLPSAISATSATSSGTGLLTGLRAASGSSGGTSGLSGFGPDFLVSAIGARLGTTGAAYNAQGKSTLPPSNSAQGKARAAKLTDITDKLKSGDTTGARKVAEGLVKDNQSDSVAVYLLGRTYLKDGDYKTAERLFVRAASCAPDNQEIAADLKAAGLLKRGLEVASAQAAKWLKNPTTAAEGLRLATYVVEANPADTRLRVAVADYYERNKKLDSAGAALSEAIKQAPDSDLADLVTRLKKFAKSHNRDPGAFDLLAQAQSRAGDLTGAEASYNQAISLAAGNDDFQRSLRDDLAGVYSQFGQAAVDKGDVASARRYFDKSLNLKRSDETLAKVFDLEVSEGDKALRLGQNTLALQYYNRAAINRPVTETDDEAKARKDALTEGFDTLAARFEASGDLRRVIQARNGSFLLDTKDDTRRRGLANAQDTYGLDLHNQGKYREASRWFREALKLYPGDTNYSAHLSASQILL